MKHLPNILTVLRILITPLFLFCLFSDFHGSKYYALFLFISLLSLMRLMGIMLESIILLVI